MGGFPLMKDRTYPVVCVTGPMAAGKNLAAAIFEKMGWVSIDADIVAHQVLDIVKDQVVALHQEKAQALGLKLLSEDGRLNRKAIAQIVFSDKEALEKHEALLFPMIDTLLRDFIEKNKEKPVVINATVLYKVPLIYEMDAVFFIDAPRCLRLLRAMKRDKRSAKEILQRFSSQKNIFAKYKISNADTCRVWNISFPWILEYKIRRILKLWIRKKHYGLSPL